MAMHAVGRLCHVLCNSALVMLASSQQQTSQQVIRIPQNAAAVEPTIMRNRSSKTIQSTVKIWDSLSFLQHYCLCVGILFLMPFMMSQVVQLLISFSHRRSTLHSQPLAYKAVPCMQCHTQWQLYPQRSITHPTSIPRRTPIPRWAAAAARMQDRWVPWIVYRTMPCCRFRPP